MVIGRYTYLLLHETRTPLIIFSREGLVNMTYLKPAKASFFFVYKQFLVTNKMTSIKLPAKAFERSIDFRRDFM